MNKWIVVLLALVMLLVAGCGGNKDQLAINVYNWGDYMDEGLLLQFEQETGIKVNYDTYNRNEDLYNELKKKNSNYDVCVPSDYMIERMIKEGMLAPISRDGITNRKYIKERFKTMPFDPDGIYSVPYFWGTVGIVYNTKAVQEPVDSWGILWNSKYKGKILMLDSPRDAFIVAEKKLGYSLNTMDKTEIEAAKQLLILQKPILLAYVNDNMKNMMINEDAVLAVAWSGEAVHMIENNNNLAFAIPKEGTNLWLDSMVIPENSQHKKEAEMFIDFMSRPDIALRNAVYMGYSTPNQGAFDMMSDTLKNNEVIYPNPGVIEKTEVCQDLGLEYLELLNNALEEIKLK